MIDHVAVVPQKAAALLLATRNVTSMVAVACLLVAFAAPALAGSDHGSEWRGIDDKFTFSIGSYLTEFKTDASVGSGGVLGTFIRAEDELGVDSDQSVVRVEGLYRFNKRHGIGFGFWTLNRDGTASIEEQIEFDGNLFDVGADLTSQFDTGYLRVDWRYSLLRTERGEAGLSAGLSSFHFDIGVEGLATVSDGMGGTTLELVRAEDDLLAPVPTVGMFLTYAFKPNLILRVNANFLDLEAGDFEGKFVDTTFLLEWWFSRHAGIGLGSNTADIDFKSTGNDPFAVNYRQSGFLGYVTFAF